LADEWVDEDRDRAVTESMEPTRSQDPNSEESKLLEDNDEIQATEEKLSTLFGQLDELT